MALGTWSNPVGELGGGLPSTGDPSTWPGPSYEGPSSYYGGSDSSLYGWGSTSPGGYSWTPQTGSSYSTNMVGSIVDSLLGNRSAVSDPVSEGLAPAPGLASMGGGGGSRMAGAAAIPQLLADLSDLGKEDNVVRPWAGNPRAPVLAQIFGKILEESSETQGTPFAYR